MKLFVNRAVLDILDKNMAVSTLVGTTLAWILYFQLYNHISEFSLRLWFGFVFFIYLARYFFSKYRRKYFDTSTSIQVFRIGSLASGLTWGWCGYFFFIEADAITRVFISFTLGGLAAGASSSLAADKYSFFFFSIPLLVPNILANVLDSSEASTSMAVMLMLYLSFLSLSCRTMGGTLIENLHLQKRAEDSEKRVKQLAFFDQLTGLPNRFSFKRRLEQVIRKHRRKGDTFALLFIDLDGFKEINDRHGHHCGDELLQILSRRFESVMQQDDTCARIGGDEFVIILPGTGLDAALKVSEKLLYLASTPVPASAGKVQVSASIGLSMYPDHALNGDDLIIKADRAMYVAKLRGKNKVITYQKEHAH